MVLPMGGTVYVYTVLGRIMTGYSIRRLRISAVLITWGNYNRGVIYDEVLPLVHSEKLL